MCQGGENYLEYLKRGWNRKQGRGNKDLKKGGKLGQGVCALKEGGGLKPPYELWSLFRPGSCAPVLLFYSTIPIAEETRVISILTLLAKEKIDHL